MRRSSTVACAFALIAAFILEGSAYAQVNVNSIIFTFNPKERPIQNVIVTNASAAPVYVSVKAEAMVDYTKEKIETTPTEDILISPKKFSIEANGQRTVRMLMKNPPTDKERGYRVYFIPQPNEFGAKSVSKTEGGVTTSIKIATGVGILVFVDPINRDPNFTWTRSESSIDFTNSGNIQVHLGDGKACPKPEDLPSASSDDSSSVVRDAKHPDSKGCFSLPSKRVYPGTKFHVAIPASYTARWVRRVGSNGQYEVLDIGPDGKSASGPAQGKEPALEAEAQASDTPAPEEKTKEARPVTDGNSAKPGKN